MYCGWVFCDDFCDFVCDGCIEGIFGYGFVDEFLCGGCCCIDEVFGYQYVECVFGCDVVVQCDGWC